LAKSSLTTLGSVYLVVEPEGEPRYHDNHEAGYVDGYNVEGQLSSKRQVNLNKRCFVIR